MEQFSATELTAECSQRYEPLNVLETHRQHFGVVKLLVRTGC